MGPLQLGMTLSQKYRVDRLLAESGGVVLYEAMDIARAQRVWIKILQREFLMNADALERFQVEASGAGVLDVGKSSDGLPYLVATEFEAAKAPAKAPLPKAPPVPAKAAPVPTKAPPLPRPSPANSKSKTTLPGVAPPPAPMRRLELQDEPPPAAPVLRVETPTAAIEARPLPPTPNPFETPDATVIDPTPIIMAQPNVPPMSVTAPMVTLPFAKALSERPKPLEPQPSEPIELPTPARGTAWMWVVLPLVAALTGAGGWYLGHRGQVDSREEPRTQTTTLPVASVATTAAPTLTIPPPPVAAVETKQAVTAETPPPPPTHVAVVVAPPASPPTHVAVATTAAPPPTPHPPTRHRPPATPSSDPLTL